MPPRKYINPMIQVQCVCLDKTWLFNVWVVIRLMELRFVTHHSARLVRAMVLAFIDGGCDAEVSGARVEGHVKQRCWCPLLSASFCPCGGKPGSSFEKSSPVEPFLSFSCVWPVLWPPPSYLLWTSMRSYLMSRRSLPASYIGGVCPRTAW